MTSIYHTKFRKTNFLTFYGLYVIWIAYKKIVRLYHMEVVIIVDCC